MSWLSGRSYKTALIIPKKASLETLGNSLTLAPGLDDKRDKGNRSIFMDKFTAILWAVITAWFVGCRADSDFSSTNLDQTANPDDIVELPLAIGAPMGLTAGGVSATDTGFTTKIAIKSCKSGYETNITSGATGISLYKGDHGCIAVLESFTIGESVFEPVGIFDPQPGSNNKFNTSDGSEASVVVVNQLSSPLELTDVIGFRITQVQAENDIVLGNFANIINIEVEEARVTEDSGQIIVNVKKVVEKSSEPLTVNLEYSGTAKNGEDFKGAKQFVVIGKDETSAQFSLSIVDDRIIENAELLKIVAKKSDDYYASGFAEVIIEDDDTSRLPGTALFHFSAESIKPYGWRVESWDDVSPHQSHALPPERYNMPFYFSKAIAGFPAVGFDGFFSRLYLPSSKKTDSAEVYKRRSFYAVVRLAGNTTREQVVFEQGGRNEGFSFTVEGGYLSCNMWTENTSDRQVITSRENKLRGYKRRHHYRDRDPYSDIVMSSFRSPITPYGSYVVALHHDAESELVTCFVNGKHIGEVEGVKSFGKHDDGIGVGSVNGSTRFASGSIVHSRQNLRGFLSEIISYGDDFDANDFQVVMSDLLERYQLSSKPRVKLSFNKTEMNESGAEDLLLEVYREKPGYEDLIVSYELHGDAIPGDDYAMTSGAIVIPAGKLRGSERIQILNDTEVEQDETIVVGLKSDESYENMSGQVLVTIIDDDEDMGELKPILWLQANSGILQEQGGVRYWQDKMKMQKVDQNDKKSRPKVENFIRGKIAALVFDGKDDYLKISSNRGFNLNGPCEGRTAALAFATGRDTKKTQVIYEEGGTARGFNIYIENGYLYLNSYNLPNDDKGKTTPWPATYAKLPIKANKAYILVSVYDFKENALRLLLNSAKTEVKGVGRLFTHPDPAGIGGVAKGAVLHNNRKVRGSHHFAGAIAELIVFDEALSPSAMIEQQKRMHQAYRESLR